MANTAKLREQARTYELRDQWREAIGAYHELLAASEGADVDIGVWNRIGDLHLRLNETELAIQAYESAVNAYVDVGLYNNAIALCRKVLRLVPGRAQTYLRLGQISAAKGFFADARTNFLEYAERMRKAGKVDAAFDALKEFADLAPDPTDVRRLLADQLLSHGRKDEAVEQLRILMGMALARGDEVGVETIRLQVIAIDPTASTDPLERQPGARSATSDDFGHAFDSVELRPRASEPSAEEARPASRPELRDDYLPTVEPGQDFGDVDLPEVGDVAPLAGLETTMMDFARDEPARRGPAPRAEEEEDEEPAGDLPFLDMDAPSTGPPVGRAADPSRFGEISLDQPLEFAPGVEGDDFAPAGDDEGEPLPLLDVGAPAPRSAPAAPAGRDRLEELRERVTMAPGDTAARDELIRVLHDRGLGHEVPEVLEEAHRALAARSQYREAVDPISLLIRLRPGDLLLLQKRVEYAFRSGERDAQVEAYLGLGRHFHAAGDRVKADAVFRRVLELDPQNAEARALAPHGPAPQPAAPPTPAPAAPQQEAPPAPAEAPQDEYVDLGSLILDDVREATTRFVVEEKEPSGDEDRDFAEMLQHFRQKVAENIEVEDSGSHYDLGLAFKEMGLLDEAIAEFQVALRGGANPLATLELLGQCFVEKGQYAVASRVLDRALRLSTASDAELVGVLYQLGRAQEALGQPAQAREYYERVLSVDIRFRDTQRRIEALRSATGAL